MAGNRNKKINRKNNRRLSLRVYVKALGVVLLLYGAGMLIAYVPHLSMFKIDTIKTNVSIGKDIMRKIKGTSIISVDIKKIHNQIKERHLKIKEVSIVRMFPSTLVIKALRRKPFAQLKGDGFYVLDEDRVVLEKRSHNPYPGILIIELGSYHFPLNPGEQARGERISLSYKLIKELKRSSLARRFKITDINAVSPYNISFLMNGINVIMGRNDFHNKIRILKELLDKKLNKRIRSIRYIDLRFASNSDNVYIGNKR